MPLAILVNRLEMSTSPSEIFVETRIRILKAVQNNEQPLVEALLQENATLIHAKTTTKGSSLLHIAATQGHLELCDFLFFYQHQTNPVDNEGQTPYQRAQTAEIKALLKNHHMKYLRDTFFTSLSIPTPKKPFINSIIRSIMVPNKQDFPKYHPDKDKGPTAFGATILCDKIIGATSDKDYGLVTIFREDILMIPHYGEFLVIHENEQAIQLIDVLANSKNGFFGTRDKFPLKEAPRLEARAYLKHVSSAFDRYPFLKELPREDDKPEIAEAKKLFITFSLCGLMQYINECTSSQIEHLQLHITRYEEIMRGVKKILSVEHMERILAIGKDMQDKYISRDDVQTPTISRINKPI